MLAWGWSANVESFDQYRKRYQYRDESHPRSWTAFSTVLSIVLTFNRVSYWNAGVTKSTRLITIFSSRAHRYYSEEDARVSEILKRYFTFPKTLAVNELGQDRGSKSRDRDRIKSTLKIRCLCWCRASSYISGKPRDVEPRNETCLCISRAEATDKANVLSPVSRTVVDLPSPYTPSHSLFVSISLSLSWRCRALGAAPSCVTNAQLLVIK